MNDKALSNPSKLLAKFALVLIGAAGGAKIVSLILGISVLGRLGGGILGALCVNEALKQGESKIDEN